MPTLHYLIQNLTIVTLEVYWRFEGHKGLAKRKTNYVHHKLIDRFTWMVKRVNKGWGMTRSNRCGKVWYKWGGNLIFLSKLSYLESHGG